MRHSAFTILDAPKSASRFKPDLEWKPELVDYASHPAYAPLISKASVGDRLSAIVRFAKSMVPLLIKRAIRYEMIPREIREPKNLSDWMKFVASAARNVVGLHPKAETTGEAGDVFETLNGNGCCVIKMDDDLFVQLEKASKEHFERLDRQRQNSSSKDREFDESRGAVDAREYGDDLYLLIEKILKESGVLAAASKYLGRAARLVDVNPQINDSSDNFWRKVFPDMEMDEIPPNAYFHRDASGGDLKAIFYMSDVGPENGPFSYVIGSNKLEMSRFDDLIAEANDHNGLSATTLDMRQKFSALPTKLRQKGSFGNDLVAKSVLSEQIEKGVWKITGSKGSIVLFDTKGVHRGGMVADGMRKVITTVVG